MGVEHCSVEHTFFILNLYAYSSENYKIMDFFVVAYGFYGGLSEIAYTTNCSLCASPEVVQYIHGVILTGIHFSLIMH